MWSSAGEAKGGTKSFSSVGDSARFGAIKAGEEMVERWRRGADDAGAGAGGTGGAPLNPLQGIGNGGSASWALLFGLVDVGGAKDREA